MSNEFLLKDEFKNWLVESRKTTEASAKSYLSYVAGADKLISVSVKDSSEKSSLFTILQTDFYKHDIKSIKQTILFVIEELSRKKAEKVFGRPLNTLHKYRSGLYSYLDFLLEQPFSTDVSMEDDISTQEIEDIDVRIFTDTGTSLTDSHDDKVYLKIDLVKNFSLRIRTQDRYYEDIFFPIRFITRVYSKRKERNTFDYWLKQLLNSIFIFLKDDNATFEEITALTITNSSVYVTHKGKQKLAYTKLSDNKTLVPFNVSTLNKIAIDHNRSMFDVMNANINRLPIILQITNELRKYIKGQVSYQKLSSASHSSNLDAFIETIDTQNLLKELELIASETSLQLMDCSQNTSKGKK